MCGNLFIVRKVIGARKEVETWLTFKNAEILGKIIVLICKFHFISQTY